MYCHIQRSPLPVARIRIFNGRRVHAAASLMRTVLFLCTGNYYRSRFAEELFNHYAPRAGLSWVARSRALAIERGVNNAGSLSPFALRALEKRGLIDAERFLAWRKRQKQKRKPVRVRYWQS